MEKVVMQQRFNFLKTTLLGGIVFLLPLALLGMVVGKVVEVMNILAETIDQWIPIDSFLHVIAVNLIALIIVLFACFFAGLATKSIIGKKLFQFLESKLSILPGYAIFKARLTGNLGSEVDKQAMKPVLVKFQEHSKIGFQVEEITDDKILVFLPGAPDPWSGTLVIVKKSQVNALQLETLEVMAVFERLGRGATQVLKN